MVGQKKKKKQKKYAKQKHNAELNKAIKAVGSFPFLSDDRTVVHVKKTKVMFIMRGLPGSGKSKIALLLQKVYKDAVICSADNYFKHDGVYEHVVDGLHDAHKSCQEEARTAVDDGRRHIVIDNTNVRRRHMRVYFDLANKADYVVVVVVPRTPWCFDVEQLTERNEHGVTIEHLRRLSLSYKPVIPLFWGWFVNETNSKELLVLADKYFDMCLKSLPKFCQFIKKNLAKGLYLNMISGVRAIR